MIDMRVCGYAGLDPGRQSHRLRIARRWMSTAVCCVGFALGSEFQPASAEINLVLVPTTPVAGVGDVVRIELWFVADGPTVQPWILADILIRWDDSLSWIGYENSPLLESAVTNTFPSTPPSATQIWWSVASFSSLPAHPGDGDLVTTFEFRALAPANPARVEVLLGDALGDTVVMDEFLNDVLGTMEPANIVISPQIPGDFDGDGDVDLFDFGSFVACISGPNHGTPPPTCAPGDFETADLDEDFDVDLHDLGDFQVAFSEPP